MNPAAFQATSQYCTFDNVSSVPNFVHLPMQLHEPISFPSSVPVVFVLHCTPINPAAFQAPSHHCSFDDALHEPCSILSSVPRIVHKYCSFNDTSHSSFPSSLPLLFMPRMNQKQLFRVCAQYFSFEAQCCSFEDGVTRTQHELW